ncbi:hypothetical protein [Xanthomonas sp. 3075]|uniref:hypothetical protein n=1 Tax=Xanthomonas sp. 3075 TaxID=3035315 RepID=UPI001608E2FE|nr:hypothetical protein [Xanthomonas sp. 3075]MBB4132970.1 hypothetical protein [Xanthomonas sp. 3075]
MPAYLYTVWFRDNAVDQCEQDHEWPACIEIVAPHAELAAAWGTALASDYARRHVGLTRLGQSIEALAAGPSGKLPLVQYGAPATDAEIGW